jgi:hypothetical protein
MPIARYIFGRDKPSLTALAHGDGEPVERRRALGLRQLFRPVPLFGLPGDDTPSPPGGLASRLLLASMPIAAGVLVVVLVWWI